MTLIKEKVFLYFSKSNNKSPKFFFGYFIKHHEYSYDLNDSAMLIITNLLTKYSKIKIIHLSQVCHRILFLSSKGLIYTQYQKDTSTRIPYHIIFWKSENPLKSYNILSFHKFNYLCSNLWDFVRTRIKSDIWSYLYNFFPTIIDIA